MALLFYGYLKINKNVYNLLLFLNNVIIIIIIIIL